MAAPATTTTAVNWRGEEYHAVGSGRTVVDAGACDARARERTAERVRKIVLTGRVFETDPLSLLYPYSSFNSIKTGFRFDDQSRVDTIRGRTLERLASATGNVTD